MIVDGGYSCCQSGDVWCAAPAHHHQGGPAPEARQGRGRRRKLPTVNPSVVDPNTLNLDPDPEFWPNLDPDPELYYQFLKKISK